MFKKSVLSFTVILAIIIAIVVGATSCRPYDKPEVKVIEPSQTAFLIPLDGKTSEQSSFMSEEYLKNSKVASKQVQIPHRWLQEGRLRSNGEYIPSMRLIVIERKPVTREWTESEKSGTSSKNEGIIAESKESIGFLAGMNCSAQIDEDDAVRFLYRYNNKPLEEIMDTEIRARIESKFVEQCSKLNLEDILVNKESIMNSVRSDVIPYFKDRGVNITVIGLKGELTYLNAEIQKSIDGKFESAKALETQRNENTRVLEKAKADAEAIKIQNETITQQLKLKELDNQAKAIDKWNGQMPTYVSGENGAIFNIPTK
jgi:SPFH domain / Band 7 family.